MHSERIDWAQCLLWINSSIRLSKSLFGLWLRESEMIIIIFIRSISKNSLIELGKESFKNFYLSYSTYTHISVTVITSVRTKILSFCRSFFCRLWKRGDTGRHWFDLGHFFVWPLMWNTATCELALLPTSEFDVSTFIKEMQW